MKRKLLYILGCSMMIGGLASCGNNASTTTSTKPSTTTSTSVVSTPAIEEKVDISNVSVLSPTGAPALAFYNYATSDKYTTNSTPANIVSQLTSAGPDVVCIDTSSGLKAIKSSNAPYKMLSTITFGNFFIASTGHDADKTMNAGDTVVLFGNNQLPDLLWNYLYSDTKDTFNVVHVASVTDANKCLVSGKVTTDSGTIDADYVFIAQPALFGALKQNTNASIAVNIQDLYKQKTGGKELVQASLFVKNTVSTKVAYAFGKKVKEDVNAIIADPTLVTKVNLEEDTFKTKYGFTATIAQAVMKQNNGFGIGYKLAKDNLENINACMSVLNPSLGTIDATYCL